MKSFYHSVGTRMVCCCTDPFYTKKQCQRVEKIRFELSAAISSDGGRDSKMGNPVGDKRTSKCVGSNISKRDGFRPTSKTIDTS